jgi:hypothetical protein
MSGADRTPVDHFFIVSSPFGVRQVCVNRSADQFGDSQAGSAREPFQFLKLGFWEELGAAFQTSLSQQAFAITDDQQGDGFRKGSTHPTGCDRDPTGKSVVRLAFSRCLVPSEKIFCFSEMQITAIFASVPSHQKGRIMIVANAGRDAVDGRAAARCSVDLAATLDAIDPRASG